MNSECFHEAEDCKIISRVRAQLRYILLYLRIRSIYHITKLLIKNIIYGKND